MSSIKTGSSSDASQPFVLCLHVSLDRGSSLPSAVGLLIITLSCEMTSCGQHTTERFQRSIIHAVREAISVCQSKKLTECFKTFRRSKDLMSFQMNMTVSSKNALASSVHIIKGTGLSRSK